MHSMSKTALSIRLHVICTRNSYSVAFSIRAIIFSPLVLHHLLETQEIEGNGLDKLVSALI